MAPGPASRLPRRRAAGLLALGLAGLVTLAGCDPRTLLYFLQPYDPSVPAPGPKLEGKKVVVVTHAVGSAMGEVQSLPRDVTREVVSILREKVKKIDVVDSDKVWTWVDGHPNWTDPEELAKAFEADNVIFFEIEAFQLQNPNDIGVYQGTSKTHVKVVELAHPKNSRGKPMTDKPKEANTIFDDYHDTEFPVRGPIPVDSGVSRSAFKVKFIKVVSAELSWLFVDHSPEDDIQDVKFNNR
jgi:hypothetical protein